MRFLATIWLLYLFVASSQAQTWYKPGKKYTFLQTVSDIYSNKSISLTVVFDKFDNATVFRKYINRKPRSTDQFCYFGPSGDVAINQLNKEETLTIIGIGNYYLIPFNYNNENDVRLIQEKQIRITSACTFGAGICYISWSKKYGLSIANPLSNNDCGFCRVSTSSGNDKLNSGAILIKANKIKIRN